MGVRYEGRGLSHMGPPFSQQPFPNEWLAATPRAAELSTQVELSGLRGCTIYLFGWSSQLTLDGCTDCSLISGPTDGAVFARGCARVRLYVACRQFRARDCNSCEAFLFTFGPGAMG